MLQSCEHDMLFVKSTEGDYKVCRKCELTELVFNDE